MKTINEQICALAPAEYDITLSHDYANKWRIISDIKSPLYGGKL